MSQETWYNKLKSYVPSWVFEEEEKSEAIFQGMAKVLCQVEDEFRAHIAETFIDTATEEYLLEHGRERGIDRLSGESLEAYRQRVKRIGNRSNCPEIKEIVDALLLNGESTILEHSDTDNFYFNRGSYANTGVIPTDLLYNAFTVIVPNQIRDPQSFANRENFSNREDIMGSNESSIELFQRIVEAVNKNKAFGVQYRLFEQVA